MAIDRAYRFVVPGNPRGYTTTNRNSRPSKTYLRFVAWMNDVRRAAIEAGVPLPLTATVDEPLLIKTIAYFKNGIHCDPENVRKGACDALFYRPDIPNPKKRKGQDKFTGGSFPPPRYDKENPRTVVIIKPYKEKP